MRNIALCKEYSNIREEAIRKGKSSTQLFLQLGREVAFRNGYIKDEYLTRINNSAIREIFSSKTKPVIYISIDFESGAFELCNHKGVHIGEISYEGKQTGPAKKDHSIKLKK